MLQYANPRSFVAHNHNPDVDAIEVATLKATLKERAVVSDVQPARLLAGALLNASDAAKDRVKMQTARRGIRRFKQGMVPPQSATRRQLDFVGPWRTTGGDDPKPFLRHDSGPNARDRVVVFAKDDSLRVLCRANTWYMNGNFSLAPSVFDQLYIIRAPLGTTCISCVYALLPGKTEAVYTQMLEAVTDACTALGFNARDHGRHRLRDSGDACCDGRVWQVHVQGCFFHLCQSTWRHVQDLGLTALYNADDVAKHFVRMLDGLALLPLADVPAGMAHLRANTPSTSTTSLTISTQLTSLDDTASFSLQPPTPPRPYHRPGSDDSRPCSPPTYRTSTSPPSLGRTGQTTCARPGTRHSSDSSGTSTRGCRRC